MGKSCLLIQFTDGVFHEEHASTVGVDFRVKKMTVDNRLVKMQMWDTAGNHVCTTHSRLNSGQVNSLFSSDSLSRNVFMQSHPATTEVHMDLFWCLQ